MMDSLVALGGIAAAVLSAIWYAFTRGKKSESQRRDEERLKSDIDTMERINAENPLGHLPVDERLHRHTGRK